MNITCDQCQSKFSIPAEKIPAGKTVILKCPKCENRISVSIPLETLAPGQGDISPEDLTESALYESEKRPFGFVDEDIQTAMICEPDELIKSRIKAVLIQMGYQVAEAMDPRMALKNMRYHGYDLIVVNEVFGANDPDSNGILIYIARMAMAVRRNIFVALLSSRFRTMDQMTAFNKSVDLIINLENLSELEKILTRGIKQKEAFYRIFKETMKKAGRA
jgi:predicted Zn finger-like uncharacterized protein